MSETEIHNGIFNLMNDVGSHHKSESADKLEANDFIVQKYCMHHGAKGKNPLMRMRFYDKMSGEKLVGPAEELPVAKQADESRHNPVIPNAFQWVGIRMLVRDDSKRSIVNFFFHQWFETGDKMPNQCAVEPTNLFQMDENDNENENDDDVENNNWQQRGTTDYPALLSQDFDDSAEENDDDDNPMFQQDMSPVPVRTRTR